MSHQQSDKGKVKTWGNKGEGYESKKWKGKAKLDDMW